MTSVSDAGSSGLRVEREARVLTLTIDRPQARNALTTDLYGALSAALAGASADVEIGAVVLTATGDEAFCSGADLSAAGPPDRSGEIPAIVQGDMSRRIAGGWQRLVAAVLDCEKPVIAAVNGLAAGGGFSLVMACDLVVMAESARLIPVFIRRGLAPDAGGTYLATRLLGPLRAKQLFFFGEDVSASDAVGLGLANEVVAATDLLAVAHAYARRLASGPSRAHAVTKTLVNHALDSDRATAFREEAWAQEMIAGTRDAGEGIASFRERRRPEFRGY